MDWISEDPWPVSGTLLALAVAAILLARFTQQGRYLYWGAGLAALGLALFGVERLWVTDRERVEATLYGIRDAAARSDYPALESFLAPDFDTPGPLPAFITKAAIRGYLQNMEFEGIHLSNVEISRPGRRTRQATADFTARASWKTKTSTGGPNYDMTPPRGTRFSFGFREVEPNVWKVTRIDILDTGNENISPSEALKYLGAR